MPWPLIPRRAHSPASCPAAGLDGASAPAACSAVMTSPSQPTTCGSSPGFAAASCPGVSCGRGENPGGDHVDQQLPRAGRRLGHGDIRRRDPLIQVDTRDGLAWSGTQVQPADLVLRVRTQVEGPGSRRRCPRRPHPPRSAPARPAAGCRPGPHPGRRAWSRGAVRPRPAAADGFPRVRGSCPQCPPAARGNSMASGLGGEVPRRAGSPAAGGVRQGPAWWTGLRLTGTRGRGCNV